MRSHAIHRAALGLALLAPAYGACGHDKADDGSPVTLAPVAFHGEILYVEHNTATAYLLDPSGNNGAGEVRSQPVGTDPVAVSVRNAHDEALVLSRGRRGAGSDAAEPSSLTVIVPTGEGRSYALGNPFNAFAQTGDGRFALVYFQLASNLGQLLFNPNEVAVVDLDTPAGSANPIVRTVRSFGGVPESVVFSPRMNLPDGPRTLAVVLSNAYVTLIDMDHPDRSETTVRLTLPEDARNVHPSQVLFDVEQSTVYLRAEATDDVYALDLAPAAHQDAAGNDFRPTINQLGAGRSPSDMALIGTGDARRLLVVSAGDQEAVVVDALSNRITPVPLAAAASRVLLFNGAAPRDPAVKPRALVYAADGSTRAVSFIDLEQLEERRGRNVETIFLDRPVAGAYAVPGQNLVVLQHPPSGVGAALSVLDLEQRTASPIYAEFALEQPTFGPDGQTLWVGAAGVDRLGWLDLRTLHPSELQLDAPVAQVIALPGDPAGRNLIAAVHDAAGGYVTVVDADEPTRDTARSFRGFLFTNALDREATP